MKSNNTGRHIIVVGGDGFCGWPTVLHLSARGYDVTIIDNLSRRHIEDELGASSLTPITSIERRIQVWEELTSRKINYLNIDVARDSASLTDVLVRINPYALVHFGEQRAAPYSMRGEGQKRYTVDNNINATHNILVAIATHVPDCHLVHLGTMGVYGYSGDGLVIPEGYIDVTIETSDGRHLPRKIVYPTNPGSVYHMTKSIDQVMFQFYAKNDKLRITDLHQGIVWGTQTVETRMHPDLVNRFDYDGDYGTVLNRFLMEAAVGYPLTVHGTGGQTRAFINIQNTVQCIELAIMNPPERGEQVRIRNQITETHRVRDLAAMVARVTGAEISFVENPRLEAAENELDVSNQSFLDLGLNPITLSDGLLNETIEISGKFADRVDLTKIPARSLWVSSVQDKNKEKELA